MEIYNLVNGIPLAEAVIQYRVVSLKHHNTIKPALGKKITTVIINDYTTLFHHTFKLITYLSKPHETHK